jgi:hypothetical protein
MQEWFRKFYFTHKNLINQEEYFQIKSTIKSIYGIIVFDENDIEPIELLT